MRASAARSDARLHLVEQGVPVDALIFVLDGEVSVTVKGIGEVARLGVGEILGEMPFVDRKPAVRDR